MLERERASLYRDLAFSYQRHPSAAASIITCCRVEDDSGVRIGVILQADIEDTHVEEAQRGIARRVGCRAIDDGATNRERRARRRITSRRHTGAVVIHGGRGVCDYRAHPTLDW